MRPLNATDFDDIYEIYMDPAVNPYMASGITDKASFQPVFDDIISRDYTWALDENDKMIGMCTASKSHNRRSHVAELRSVALNPNYHGESRAENFVNHAIETLKQDGFKRIEAWAEGDNPKAIRFYEKLGFQIDGRLPKAFKRENSPDYIDHLVMSKIF